MDATNKLKAEDGEIRDRRMELEKRKLQLENELEKLKKAAARITTEKTTPHDQKP